METNKIEQTEWDKIKYFVFSVALVIVIVTAYFIFSKETHYEKGLSYISKSQYLSAKEEFYLIDSNDNDFEKSRDCIRYIDAPRYYKSNYDTLKVLFRSIKILNKDYLKTLSDKYDSTNLLSDKKIGIEFKICKDVMSSLNLIETRERIKAIDEHGKQFDKMQPQLKELEEFINSLDKKDKRK